MRSDALTLQEFDNTVLLWNDVAIDAARDNNSGSLVMVRALPMMHTAMFDAWAQYDHTARPTLGTPAQRPASERRIENKREATSFAAHAVLADIFPADRVKFDKLMLTLGYHPKIESIDPTAPPAIGLDAAAEILEYRHHHGANQLGDLHPGSYSDYTRYATANSPDIIRDPDHWQLLKARNGESPAQVFYMPHWGLVKPLDSTQYLTCGLRPVPRHSDQIRAGTSCRPRIS
jgi:hypothetical protein